MSGGNGFEKQIVDLRKIITDNDFDKFSVIGDFLNTYSEKNFSFPFLYRCDGCDADIILQTLTELKEVQFYQSNLSPYIRAAIIEIAEKVSVTCLNIALSHGITVEQLSTNSDELNRYVLKSLLFLQKGDFREALRCLLIYASYGEKLFNSFPQLFYYRGLVYYGLHEYDKARNDLEFYLKMVPNDEIAHFHLGNVYIRLNKLQPALDAYTEALKIRSHFDEILLNANTINEKILSQEDNLDCVTWPIIDSPMEATLKIDNSLDIWDIPIFINNFNRLGCLQNLVDWLLQAGYRRIYILDNASTYEPLLSYYDMLRSKELNVQVITLGHNMGHKALWDSGVLEQLNIETPYVYTDSDVIPSEQCPKNVLFHLLKILEKFSFLKKVGLGLITDDITFFDSDGIKAWEKKFYLHEIDNNVYFGAVDTTFALYRNYRHYNVQISARTTGKYMARHLPWYYDYKNLPEDEKYYAEHANASSTMSMVLRKRGINNGFKN